MTSAVMYAVVARIQWDWGGQSGAGGGEISCVVCGCPMEEAKIWQTRRQRQAENSCLASRRRVAVAVSVLVLVIVVL